jgi:hypothetical protein
MSSLKSPYVNMLPLTNDEISKYNIFYEENCYAFLAYSYDIAQTFQYNLTNWHRSKYLQKPEFLIEYSDNITTIKYHTQFVKYTVTIIEEPFTLDNEFMAYKCHVKGLTITITLQQMNCITQFSNDFEDLIIITKNINEHIIKENKEVNDDINDEIQKLCGIEYAMDHC